MQSLQSVQRSSNNKFRLLTFIVLLQSLNLLLEPPTSMRTLRHCISNILPLSVIRITFCNNSNNSLDRRRRPPLLASPPSTTRIQEAVQEEECATGKVARCAATVVQRSTIE